MQKTELSLLQAGDEIDYTTIVLTTSGLVDGGLKTSIVAGLTDQSALINSDKFQGLTIAVQAHHIVAARRGLESIYVDIQAEPKESR